MGVLKEVPCAFQAPLLYPLFGIGANVGQTLSGKLLSMFSSAAAPRLSYARQLQAIMLVSHSAINPVFGLHWMTRTKIYAHASHCKYRFHHFFHMLYCYAHPFSI